MDGNFTEAIQLLFNADGSAPGTQEFVCGK